MPTVTSADGTPIGYEATGSGPALVLVDGACCFRAFGPMRPLAALLQEHFTVYCYDRRGRGESGSVPPYAAPRETEDLQAVIAAAGGSAGVYTMSSGGAIGLAAAALGSGIEALAVYEPPYVGPDPAYTSRLHELLAAGRHGDAVELFQRRVGMPPEAIAGFRASPGFAVLEGIAPTLAYDDAVLAPGHLPPEVAAAVAVPTTLVAGGASPAFLQEAARATAAAIPGARFEVLEGQTHGVDPAALAPLLVKLLR
ncbi:alpha/beta fold hydrolase [Dactylosporangium sp. NPDC049140]|jgi:pimeloyl-ACP methyl ester carboxylesterase|uniref:alpha/beta fold hydrolase n=1 Tax=Dactylosporangium sp. NPDC049140 TaxID=3155647 RepID=UPI0033F16A82